MLARPLLVGGQVSIMRRICASCDRRVTNGNDVKFVTKCRRFLGALCQTVSRDAPMR